MDAVVQKMESKYFYYVLPASHDHVWTLVSKRTSLPCKNIIGKEL